MLDPAMLDTVTQGPDRGLGPQVPDPARSSPEAYGSQAGAALWSDAILAAMVLVAGAGSLGGLRLRAGAGPVRDRWLEMCRLIAGPVRPWLRIPAMSAAGRLTGGIDIAATLTAGRPVHESGLLARADGGFLVLGMAERLPQSSAAIIGRALDDREVTSSAGNRSPARFAVVALDEGDGDEEDLSSALSDRLSIDVRLDSLSIHDAKEDVVLARELGRTLPSPAAIAAVLMLDDSLTVVAELTGSLPGSPLRRALDLARVARIVAAIEGEACVVPAHLALAIRLCLGPLSMSGPADAAADGNASDDPPSPSEAAPEAPPATAPEAPPGTTDGAPDLPPPASEAQGDSDAAADAAAAEPDPETILVEAARASAAVLAELARTDRSKAAKSARTGKSGGFKTGSRRGRPTGIVSRPPYAEARPDVVATLRAAIPWQRLRNPAFGATGNLADTPLRILPTDFRYIRFRHRTESTAIFAVDASGSTAMDRLAEAKGAIELLLGDCYVRRDHVALVSFRGYSAETLLEPTRSLVRAKRSLTGLPGGGPTPLAAGIREALGVAGLVQRRGQSPLIVYLTDGSGNVALDGRPDRPRAAEDATQLARQSAALGYRAILIDVARRPKEATRALAQTMQAHYFPLPLVSAAAVSSIVASFMQKN